MNVVDDDVNCFPLISRGVYVDVVGPFHSMRNVNRIDDVSISIYYLIDIDFDARNRNPIQQDQVDVDDHVAGNFH